jgi:hypothetical protein
MPRPLSFAFDIGIVTERGPEIVIVPAGAEVVQAGEVKPGHNLLTVYVHPSCRDVEELAQRIAARLRRKDDSCRTP